MCDSPELLSVLAKVEDNTRNTAEKHGIDPVDLDIQVCDTKPWTMSYRGYRHVFMWLPLALTLNLGEYGTGPVQAQVWINLGLKPGTTLVTSGQATPTEIRLRFTNESIP